MKQIKSNNLTQIFFIIPICILIIAFVGIGVGSAKVYSNVITIISDDEGVEMPLSYIYSKIKRSIDGKVYIKNIEGQEVIVLTEKYEDEEYENWIYCYEGNLYEAFMLKGMEFNLNDGIKIIELNDLETCPITSNLLEVKVVTSEGEVFSKLIKVKAEVI